MIDFATLQRYDLELIVAFDRFERMWHGSVSGTNLNGEPQTMIVVDQDPVVAASTAIVKFVADCRPKADGSA
jgi:hypothetical protein